MSIIQGEKKMRREQGEMDFSLRCLGENGIILKKFLICVRQTLTQGNLNVDQHGITLCSMDDVNCAMLNMHVFACLFQNYQLASAQANYEVGVPFKTLVKVMERKNADSIELAYDGTRMYVSVENSEQTDMGRCSINTMSLETSALDVPDYPAHEIAMTASRLHGIVKELKDVGGMAVKIDIDTKASTLSFSSGGDEVSTVSRCLQFALSSDSEDKRKARPVVITLAEDEMAVPREFSASYSLEKLFKFTGPAEQLSDSVVIKLHPEMPISLTYNVFGGDGDQERLGYLQFYLASKIAGVAE